MNPRDFEILIARIEAFLGSDNVKVKSPDKIPDIATGQLREVDASIRCKIGSMSVLFIIECRMRTGPQDVRWIEQIETKIKSVGANGAIAVSASGFTEPAKIKAKALGIETRTLDIVTDESASDLLKDVYLGVQIIKYSFGGKLNLGFNTPKFEKDLLISNEIVDAVDEKGPKAHFLFSRSEEPPLNLVDLGNIYLQHGWPKEVPRFENTWIPTQALAVFPPCTYYSHTNMGDIDVINVLFQVNILLDIKQIPITKIYEYKNLDGPIVYVKEADLAEGIVISTIEKV